MPTADLPAAEARLQPAGHPETARRQRLRSSASTPALTYYDESVPARIELSATTLDNWVAKAANLLSLEFDVSPGDAVGLDMTGNWLQPIWAAAIWGIGGVVALPDSGAAATAEVQIISRDRFESLHVSRAESTSGQSAAGSGWADAGSGSVAVLVCSNHPLGAPLGSACPPGAIDALAELPGQPDVATLLPPDPAMNILATGSELLTGSAAMLRAGAMADKASSRIAVAPGRSPEADFFAAVLVPLALSASTVLVVNAEPSRMTAIARAERADEWHN